MQYKTAREALNKGRVKFFDASVENPDGSRGNYRQALFSRILTITGNGITYIVDHASAIVQLPHKETPLSQMQRYLLAMPPIRSRFKRPTELVYQIISHFERDPRG